MGRHSALEGSSVHPLVAEGLARRAAGTATPRRGGGTPRSEGGLGWPEPAVPGGGGLGWPGDLDGVHGERAVDGVPVGPEAPRRGWRRLFGQSSAA